MKEFNLDGEIHALDKNYAYTLSKYEIENDIEIIKNNHLLKYAKYIFENNKEDAIYFIKEYLCNLKEIKDCHFIKRTPETASLLSQYGTYAMKFKRLQIDNIEET